MAKSANTTIIGTFVITTIALLILAVVIFGSGSLFKQYQHFVLYFNESIKGLSVGSPVMFRGVQIGEVGSIVLLADDDKVSIPVTIKIDQSKFQVEGTARPDIYEQVEELIDLGLRAQLDIHSIVTGQLMIQFDFLPDTPVEMADIESEFKQLPTIRSTISELRRSLKELPLRNIADNLLAITDELNTLLGSGRLNKTLDQVDTSVANINKLIIAADSTVLETREEMHLLADNLDQSLDEVLVIIGVVAASITKASAGADGLLTDVRKEVRPVSDSFQETLSAAGQTLEQAQATLVTVDRFVEQSDTRHKLNRSLDEIAEAARSLRGLTEYLERHPEALLKGKNR